MNTYEETYTILHDIYHKHRKHNHENGDSKQMCCMWSTDDPPDQIEGTDPFLDVETAFNITIDDDDALDLYDMYLKDAAKRIMELQKRN